jgi:dinuclear metal center YbgI/SA1388 family protein
MKISQVIEILESIAPPTLQEPYDNCGLLTGHPSSPCTGILCCLDATEEVIDEAILNNCGLVIAHHPIIFGGLKKINGSNYVERTIIKAIKNEIAIYAIHTNLDNIDTGVNKKIGDILGLQGSRVLAPKGETLSKLFTFVPIAHAAQLRQALFDAGGGQIGNYSECSFNTEGMGTFKAGSGSEPFVGKRGELHTENEMRIELVFPSALQGRILSALRNAHPYEEVAFDIVTLTNPHPGIGSGMIGQLPEAVDEETILTKVKRSFGAPVIRHTALIGRPIKTVAVCGGAGSFLIAKALSAGVDLYLTADIKYHEFFDADGRMLLCDIGHYESEQFTIDLLTGILAEKFPTFAVRKTSVITNPVHYF